MENNFSKIQSKYLFYAKWVDDNSEEKAIAVILSVDYKSQTFSIVPENTSNDKFAFIGGNKNTTAMWYAVAEAIVKANTFARKELNFE
jgi:hypothetical protein